MFRQLPSLHSSMYRRDSPYSYSYNNPICVDKSDQVFPINTTCRQYNKVFLETYRTLWCSGNTGRGQGHKCEGQWDNGKLEDWFSQEDDEKIYDPHGCVGSCKSTSAVLPVNMKTSSTATQMDSAFIWIWCVMATRIQAVEEMMKVLITAMKSTTRRGLL